MVTTSPVPSPSIAPPSRIQSPRRAASPALVAPVRAPIVWSPGIRYLPPQPLNPNSRASRAPSVGHHQRPGIAQPDVAIDPPLERHRRADQRPRPRFVGLIAHQQPHLLPALRHRIGKGRDLLLRAVEDARPLLGEMREADPQPVLRMPFRASIT